MQKFTITIHGGAGTILKQDLTPQLEQLYLSGLQQAQDAGFAILENGGTALNAVVAAVVSLENNILFNAGKGSVFTKNGEHEMDAAVMEGKNLFAGAVAGVKNIANPVELALAVMQQSNHVFLSGQGAVEFAKQQNIKMMPDEYFYSQFRYHQWQAVSNSDTYMLDHNINIAATILKDKKFGTVGAAACDKHGNIAAATSTGGMTNKQYNRIGDTPVIGSGTYANNNTCAISCTGHGEMFLRAVAAYDVSCLMEYKNLSLTDAMQIVVNEKLMKINGEGGMVGVDNTGNFAMIFNSEGMYRGVKSSDGTNETAIYR